MSATKELEKKAINYVRANPNFLKMHIFFKVTKARKPDPYSRSIHNQCFEDYKKMCEKYGDDAMDYQEFEFWYMRFSRGEFDMDYDSRLAPRTRSFTDLPIHIFEMIAEHFDMYDRLSVREVSKAFRSPIDTSLPNPSKINIQFGESSWTVEFDDESIEFVRGDKSGCNHWVPDLSRLLSIFQNPKLKLKTLELRYSNLKSSERFNKMLQIAQNKNPKIRVKKLNISANRYSMMDLNTLMAIQYLDPETLQIVCFTNDTEEIADSKKVLKKLVGLKQFQRIRRIWWYGNVEENPVSLTFLSNAPRVNIKVPRKKTARDLAEMIKPLMQSTVLEKSFFRSETWDFPVPTLLSQFKRPDFFKAKGIPANILFYKIQESQFYRIEITQKLITIKKVDHLH